MASRSDELPGNIVHAPHPPLTEYYDREEDRRTWVGEQFDKTAADYDRIENILGLGTGSSYRRKILGFAGLQPGMRVLDVGMGTGLVAKQAALLVGDPGLITGVDPSPGMIRSARLPSGVMVVEGRAELIPLADAGYDFLSMGYALRHVSDMAVAFAEFHRVLKPGGKVCILEITPPKGRSPPPCSRVTASTPCPRWRDWSPRTRTPHSCGVTTGIPSKPVLRPSK